MIRLMADADLAEITDLEKELFPDHPWPLEEFQYELHENPYALFYIYEENQRILGYCDLWIMYEQAEIANIAVRKEEQSRGIGRALLNHAAEEAVKKGCENLTLEVRVSNAPAVHLYEKYGFIQAAVRKHYYENGEDALLMIKPIGGMEYDSITSN